GIEGQIRINETNPNPNIYDSGVSFADIENDGDLDLHLCSFYHANLLYLNDGTGHFTNVAPRAGVEGEEQAFSNLGCWADVNRDGLLDLLVTNQTRSDRLYLNQGSGRFRDITDAAGITIQFGSMCASFCDLDQDRDPDLVIPNQQGFVRILRHNGLEPATQLPRYEDVTRNAGLTDWPSARCHHATLGDVDNDGDPDLFVTFALVPDKLFLNDGRGHFKDVSFGSGFRDSTNSKGALFFDADNDGWLDLFVGGKGATWFYRNLGQGRFEDATEKMHLKLYRDINGIACGDFDTDKSPAMRGALDLYVASYDQSSAIFINPNGGQNYFKFKLIGTVSNRDAIGARVYLYTAGHLGEKAYLHGMREVAASGGYFSMSSTIIHFGADPQLKYDARFVFPSGIEVVRGNLTPGIFLTIYEQTGWARFIVETKRWFLRNLSNPANQRELLWLLVFLLLLVGTYSYCIKKAWGHWRTHLAMLAPPIILFFLIKFFTCDYSLWLFDGLAFTLSALLLGLGCWFNYRESQQLTREERLRTLLNSCRAFEHSQWLSSGFNQLGLLFVNIEPLQPVPMDLKNLVMNSIDNFYQFIYQEIDKISELARHVFPGIDATQKLNIMNLKLSRLLNQAKIEVELKNCISQEQHQNIPRYVTQIQKHLKAIANKVDQNFAAPLLEVLQRVQQDYAPAEIDISIQPAINAPEIQVRMLPSELLMVLNTLFSNALRAMAQQTTRKIKIQIQADQFEVRLSFQDNGCGIEPEFQTGLFMNGHTSKSDHTGGFGLFHAKSMLNLYGGEIQLASSTPGQGTEFLVTFRRID
ncbi:FG-GAP-like repeat-containing protein, partial [candidate division KSB1 bacterium]|nr:FG-GAP-like repeat-containing protein [candidate division KSB1 bacterium]